MPKEPLRVIFPQPRIPKSGVKYKKAWKRRFDPEAPKSTGKIKLSEELVRIVEHYLDARTLFRTKANISITSEEIQGTNSLSEPIPELLYAHVSSLDFVEKTEDDTAHWQIHLEAISGNWFDEVWRALYAVTDEAREFYQTVSQPGWNEPYAKLPVETRALLYRVHMHYLMWTRNEDAPAPIESIALRVEADSEALPPLESLHWIGISFTGTTSSDDELDLPSTETVALRFPIGLTPEQSGPAEYHTVEAIHLLTDELHDVLVGLYFTHYMFQVNPDDPGDAPFTPNPGDLGDCDIFDRIPPEFKPGNFGPRNPMRNQDSETDMVDEEVEVDVEPEEPNPLKRKFDELYEDELYPYDDDEDFFEFVPDPGGVEEPDRKRVKIDGMGFGAPAPPPPANPMIWQFGSYRPFVAVNDVGSGNCISLYGRNGVPVAYTDFGYPLPANVNTYPGHFAGAPVLAPCVCSDPVMIVSHWDYDHYMMSFHQQNAYNLRWLMPEQHMGAVAAQTLYLTILMNVGGAGSAALYLWPAGAPGHLITPFGIMERGTHPAPLGAGGANKNESCLITHVRVEEGGPGPPPAANWPAVFSNPAGPVVAGIVPPLPFPLPMVAPPAIGAAAAAGGLPAGPVGLGVPVGGGGAPAFANNDRYILLPGDNGYRHIGSLAPAIANAALPRIVGIVAPHHGAHTWIPGATGAALTAAHGNLLAQELMNMTPTAPGLVSNWALAVTAAMPTAVQLNATGTPPAPGYVRPNVGGGAVFPAPAADPLAAIFPGPNNGIVPGARIAYSYGINAATGAFPFGHPHPRSLLLHSDLGWCSRLSTAEETTTSADLARRYFPNWDGLIGYPGAGPAPNPDRVSDVALGWQPDGMGNHTYFYQDLGPIGVAIPPVGAPIQRTCPVCGTIYTYQY